MTLLVNEIPKLTLPLAEIVKINSTYNLYRDVALFWTQNEDQAVISMLDGNMVIYNQNADIEELGEFIKMIAPASIFSDADTLTALFKNEFHQVNVMKSENSYTCSTPSDDLSSKEIYNLLSVKGLELPPYEFFAVDFCHKLNHGGLKYFALKDCCAAVAILDGQAILVNGIASHKKGGGSLALSGLLSQCDGVSLAVCEDDVVPFYQKNNFKLSYFAGYWRKNF